MTSTLLTTNVADQVLAGMKKSGWSDSDLAVVKLWWEFDALPPFERAKQRYNYAVRMLNANGGSFLLSGNRPTPEPLEQLRVALDEIAAGNPHVFFPKAKKGGAPSDARAYSREVRERILGLAAAAVMRLHRNIGTEKRQAMGAVAQLMLDHGYTSATGKFTGQPDGLTKHCAAAEAGKATFQRHYDFAMQFEPPKSDADFDLGVYRLLEALVVICTTWRLLPHTPKGNSRR